MQQLEESIGLRKLDNRLKSAGSGALMRHFSPSFTGKDHLVQLLAESEEKNKMKCKPSIIHQK